MSFVTMSRFIIRIADYRQSENKNRDSNECVINNYDFDDTSTDHRNCGMYWESEWPTCNHDTLNIPCVHCGNIRIGVAKVSKNNTKSTCNCCPQCAAKPAQTNAQNHDPPCQRSLLEQAMEYLYSLVFNHRSHCERCHPKPPPCADCPHKKAVCPRCKAEHSDAQPPCPNDQSPCPGAKSTSNNAKSSWLGSKLKKPRSNATPPCPNATPPCPNATPPCPNATPPCPNATPPCPNATPPCPNATPPCPNAAPPCPNAAPPCPNAAPPCPNAKQPCCTSEQPSKDAEQPCCKPVPCSDTKPPCQNCPAAKSNNNYENSLNANDSYCCKESLFQMAKTYLQKIMDAHQNACPHCTKQLACCYAKELLKYLREIIEQAWAYTKKYYEQVCQQELESASCNTGVLKCPPNYTPCACSAKNGNDNPPPPCPPPPCPAKPCPICFPEPEENNGQTDQRFTPCCLHNSKGAEPYQVSGITHNKSCCLSRTLHSHTEPYDADIEPEISECSLDRESSDYLQNHDVMGLLSTNNCGPCGKDHVPKCSDETDEPKNENENQNVKRKLGLSLSMEPNDHRFCTRPDECKHSKESLNKCESPPDPAPEPEPDTCDTQKQSDCHTIEQSEQANLPCTGGCKKCNTPNAIPTICERRMADEEYKAFLDDQLGKIEKRLKDKETLCRSDCNCLTCIMNRKTGPNYEEEKDEENYYYF